MPTVGILHSGTSGRHNTHIKALTNKIKKTRAKIVALYGDHDPNTIQNHVANLIKQKVDVLVAAGGSACAEEAKKQTAGKNINVVFTSVSDSFIPGPNMTGIYAHTVDSDVTRLRLLHEALPGETTFGVLVASRPSPSNLSGVAANLGLTLDPPKDVTGGDKKTFDAAFKDWKQRGINAVVVTANPFFNANRKDVVKAATANGISAIYQWREFVEEGGLMSYGTNLIEAYELAGICVDGILSGAAIQDLPPVWQTHFELVINQGTAKKLHVKFPRTLRARVDKVIK